ncbi:MAG: hypothetical protein D6696_03400 [Acidobacteria bacterium]|nr:MAG: hypothetical protein D6696_03400 [Acidobacteriota bacterium]
MSSRSDEWTVEARWTGSLRAITAVIGSLLALGAIFRFSDTLFFAVCLIVVGGAAVEYSRLARRWVPSAPLVAVPVLVVATSSGLYLLLRSLSSDPRALALWLIGGLAAVILGPALVVLASHTRIQEAGLAAGLMSFGVPYFTAATVGLFELRALDPWLLVVFLAAIWSGDTAAYYVGSRLGRHKLAPVVSPNKSWEGAVAGFAGSVLAAAVWSYYRLGAIDAPLLLVVAVTAVVGQVGDLLQSLFKRGVGVKDSSQILPGHGGLWDRLDALILATPIFLLGLWWLGPETVIP